MNTISHDFDHRLLRENAFGLVDPSALDQLPQGIAVTPLVHADLAASSHLMPQLVDLRTLPDDREVALLVCLHDAYVVRQPPPLQFLVKSEIDAALFTKRWNAMQLVKPRDGMSSWLRLHDPRVLHQLLRILSPAQRPLLFMGAEAYTYWLGGGWVTARADDAAMPDQLAEPPAFYRGTADWDWPRIERIGMVNRALYGAGVRAPEALTRQGALAEQLIARAESLHRLSDNADLVEFATRGLAMNATFDQHPQVAALIRPGPDPADDSSLVDRLARVDDGIWNALRQASMAQPSS